MVEKKNKWKGRVINLVFFGLLLFFLISTPAKSWLLRQLVSTGLFSAKIEKPKDSTSSVTAMPLTFVEVDGNTFSTEAMRGKVVFINFWASWCPPCRAEMPSMNKLYNKLKDDSSIAFVFINLDDKIATAKKYLDNNEFSIPLHRVAGFIPTDIYTGSLPTTVVLDKQGKIVMKHTGMAGYDSKRFIEQLKSL